MKRIASFTIFMLFLLLLTSIPGVASSFFKVQEVSPIKLAPGDETNFTVNIKSLGSQGQYVKPIFRNLTAGLIVQETGGLKYILSTANRTYNLTIKAENISPGNYSFQVGIAAKGAPSNWKTAYAVVESPEEANASLIESTMPKSNFTPSIQDQDPKESSPPRAVPAFGILFALAALILAARRFRG